MQAVVTMLQKANRFHEKKYLVRTLSQNLRIGATLTSVLAALARAVTLHRNPEATPQECTEAVKTFESAYYISPNLDMLVPTLIEYGVEEAARRIKPAPGCPVCPMLARPAKGVDDVLKRFKDTGFLAEFKYDGQRAQIHINGSQISIFSRHLDDSTNRWPDVVHALRECSSSSSPNEENGGGRVNISAVLDAEFVAIERSNNSDNNRILSFQSLSTRKRGDKKGGVVDIDLADAKVQICVFLFDLMYLNGESLLHRNLEYRRSLLKKHFRFKEGFVEMAKGHILPRDMMVEKNTAASKLKQLVAESVDECCEGLMIKALTGNISRYDPCRESRRAEGWLKLKRDYVDGMADTLDLIPIGAWWGRGKRAGLLSPFLAAVYDAQNDQYQSVCRVMTGLSEQQHKQISEKYKKLLNLDDMVLEKNSTINDRKMGAGKDIASAAVEEEDDVGPEINPKPKNFLTGEKCKVWFPSPMHVWEVKGADLTLSPKHMAGKGLNGLDKGVSLRFPRIVRIREDKTVEQASQPSDIMNLYNAQKLK